MPIPAAERSRAPPPIPPGIPLASGCARQRLAGVTDFQSLPTRPFRTSGPTPRPAPQDPGSYQPTIQKSSYSYSYGYSFQQDLSVSFYYWRKVQLQL